MSHFRLDFDRLRISIANKAGVTTNEADAYLNLQPLSEKADRSFQTHYASFTTEERLTIALLCRFHRKSMPQARHAFFQDVTASVKKLVLWLVPILRLADGLDRSHDQRVESAKVEITDKVVTILLESEIDMDLELWAGERVAEVFQQIYGRQLALRQAS